MSEQKTKAKVQEPVWVSGGKRLNFARWNEWDEDTEDFQGFGKDRGCYPSASWEELCALATVIVAHPAYRPITELPGHHQPETSDD